MVALDDKLYPLCWSVPSIRLDYRLEDKVHRLQAALHLASQSFIHSVRYIYEVNKHNESRTVALLRVLRQQLERSNVNSHKA